MGNLLVSPGHRDQGRLSLELCGEQMYLSTPPSPPPHFWNRQGQGGVTPRVCQAGERIGGGGAHEGACTGRKSGEGTRPC